ncbi:hypothetical protein ACVPOS_15805 [Staphylococcus aureus]
MTDVDLRLSKQAKYKLILKLKNKAYRFEIRYLHSEFNQFK